MTINETSAGYAKYISTLPHDTVGTTPMEKNPIWKVLLKSSLVLRTLSSAYQTNLVIAEFRRNCVVFLEYLKDLGVRTNPFVR